MLNLMLVAAGNLLATTSGDLVYLGGASAKHTIISFTASTLKGMRMAAVVDICVFWSHRFWYDELGPKGGQAGNHCTRHASRQQGL